MCDVTDFNKFHFPEPLILLKKVSQKRRVKKHRKKRVLMGLLPRFPKIVFFEINDFFRVFLT